MGGAKEVEVGGFALKAKAFADGARKFRPVELPQSAVPENNRNPKTVPGQFERGSREGTPGPPGYSELDLCSPTSV